jgi:phage terminase small subunit
MSKEIKLATKQELFCKEYIIDFNATQAYIRAGYKTKNTNTAKAQASKLLTNHNIQEKINELKQIREEKLEVNAEWVLKEAIEIYKIAKGELPHTMSYKKNGVSTKVDIHKTNLREACKALEIIGKHTSIKAFEKDIDLGEGFTFAITVPQELTPKHKE